MELTEAQKARQREYHRLYNERKKLERQQAKSLAGAIPGVDATMLKDNKPFKQIATCVDSEGRVYTTTFDD